MPSLGCDFTVKFAQTGYQAAESFVKWLESGGRQIHHIEANDSKFYVSSFPLWPTFLEARFALTMLRATGPWSFLGHLLRSSAVLIGSCSGGTLQYINCTLI